MMRRMRTPVLVALVAVALTTSCTGSLLETKQPIPTVYVMTPAPAESAPPSNSAIDLAVSIPTAAPGIDTDRIAVIKESRRLDYYREAQWGATLPQVAQALIVGSMQNQQLFRSVTSEQARVSANYFLDLAVRDFQAEYADESAPPTVKVTLVGSLIRIKDRKMIASIPASASVTANENRLGVVIEAFESAARQAALTLGKQTAAAIASAKTTD